MFERLQHLEPWTVALGLAVAAILGALVVHRLGRAILLRATQRAPVLHAVVEAIDSPARVALPLFALQMLWQAAPDDMNDATIAVRILVSAGHPQRLWDLRCRVREDMRH